MGVDAGATATTAIVVAGLGLLVGSFLNVVIHRVPRGESVVRPRSRCPGCGREISARDNIPLLSWILLKGHCRGCGTAISVRYPLVEAGNALLWLLMLWRFGCAWELPAYLYFASIGLALSVIDLDTHRLPDRLTLPSYGVLGVLLLLPAVAEGGMADYARAWLAGLALFAFYFIITAIYPAGMGFGDVKLSGVLGLVLGWLGWGSLLVGGFLGFLLGALVGVGLMMLGRVGRKTSVPFGPFMVAGALVAIIWGERLWSSYQGSFS